MKNSNPSRTRNQYFAAVVATTASIATGMSLGWSSPIEAQMLQNDDTGKCDYDFCVSKFEFAWIAACVSIGSMVSATMTGPIMSAIGRKRSLALFLTLIGLGWLLLTLAHASWTMYLARLLIGFGFGGTDVIVPVYVGEIAQTSIRGRLLSLVEASFSIGALLTYILGYFFSAFFQNLISTLLIASFGVAVFFIPESPRYFVHRSKITKAKQSFAWLRGKNYDPEDEIFDIIDSSYDPATQGLKAFFSEKPNRKALMIVMGLLVSLEMSGINAVYLYAASIFEDANIGIQANFAVLFVGCCAVLGNLTSFILVDKLGRRVLLLVSYSVVFICFITIGTYFYFQSSSPDLVEDWQTVPVIFICIYTYMNAGGAASVAFIMLGEVFPQNVKDIAAGLSMTSSYVCSIIVALLFPLLTETMGSAGTFYVFSVFHVVAFVFILFSVPETKGKSLEQIQRQLLGRSRF